MRLSEAIRLGAMNRPQAFHYLCDLKDGGPGGTCALGAAADAVGILNHAESRYSGKAPMEWKAVALYETQCPCGCVWFDQAQLLIRHLNNDARWTREQIADWVESIENAQTTPAESREEVRTEEQAVAPAASAESVNP